MKKRILFLLAAACVSLTASADEGMWMLPYLQKMNIKVMKERGCKLSADEIYSVNESSLKDAIVVFGGGCTGEIVSPEGLLFTNHHCGYASIQQLSSVEHDYLANGFWAMSQAEELPVPGLKVRFVRHIMDVTADVLGNVPSTASQSEYERITAENMKVLTGRLQEEHPSMEISVKPFFGGNQFFAFVMEVYTDVRLVGAPPRRSASLAAIRTTGCGPATRATSPFPRLCRCRQPSGRIRPGEPSLPRREVPQDLARRRR